VAAPISLTTGFALRAERDPGAGWVAARGSDYADLMRRVKTAGLLERRPLLIRGFGVRVPGGAPVLTWAYS
jgi:hypothetical protein